MVEHARAAVDGRQPETEARGRLALMRFEPLDLLEDDAELVRGNARAGVPHLDGDAIAFPPAADEHAAAPGIADGGREEVLQDALQQGGIADHHRPGRHYPQAERALLRHRLEGCRDAVDHLANDQRTRLRLQRASVELGY